MRGHTHTGEDGDVDLRVSEKPKEVLPQQWRAAMMGDSFSTHQQI